MVTLVRLGIMVTVVTLGTGSIGEIVNVMHPSIRICTLSLYSEGAWGRRERDAIKIAQGSTAFCCGTPRQDGHD